MNRDRVLWCCLLYLRSRLLQNVHLRALEYVCRSTAASIIINTSYRKLPFASGEYPDKLLLHQALN